MSGPATPTLPSAFPRSPATVRARNGPSRLSQGGTSGSSSSPLASPSVPEAKPRPPPQSVVRSPAVPEPLVPLTLVDAPTQRLYAISIFVILQAWKFYDVAFLYSGDGDSMSELWFCMKWLSLDGVFFWLLPFLRIPWLTFSHTFTLLSIMSFCAVDVGLSLKYQIPVTAVINGAWKLIHDRETSISERSVKWYDIVHNDSHIQGKYTVHILPEGAAMLNPDGNCFCLGSASPTVTIPIRINGTQPINIQLTHISFDTADVEMINIHHKEIKKLLKRSPKEEETGLRYLPYVVKKPGIYRLSKVKDVSELDVRVQRSEALVVSCPKAVLVPANTKQKDVCLSDMSNVSVKVEGLAPLSITYTRDIKGHATTVTVDNITPEDFKSPLLRGFSTDGTLAEQGGDDLSWASHHSATIPLMNESLASSGSWQYEINKVKDACGNVIDYQEETENWGPRHSRSGLSHSLMVHDRPVSHFQGCTPQKPMELPRGRSGALPIKIVTGQDDGPYNARYAFTPYDKLESGTEHSLIHATTKDAHLANPSEFVLIKEPGLYTLQSVSSRYCSGNIMEPSSCLVITPPQPSMTMDHDEILDKCTGSSIGLTIDLTLVGSPPFDLSYRLIKDGGTPAVKTLRIDRTRHQVRFTPEDAGHYAYEFFNLDDKNYAKIKIDSSANRVEQTVKPLASASFVDLAPQKKCCIDEPVEFNVKMQGTAPLTLHYDIIHNGHKKRYTDKNITESIHTIRTLPLTDGGDHSLVLIFVEDRSGCKTWLESEAKINVRFQRPRAQFAPIDNKFHVRALEDKKVKLPLRLTGERPWHITFKNNDLENSSRELEFSEPNPAITVDQAGTFQIESVRDSGCSGNVDPGNSFTITWIERPKVRIPSSVSIVARDDIFVRKDVCEGDEDAVEVAFTGSPPFTLDYERLFRAEGTHESRRSPEKSPHRLTAGLGVATVRLETFRSGLYQYRFLEIADALYDDPKETRLQSPLVLEQTVHLKPSTIFAQPHKVYKYCLDSGAGDDIIPINLQGLAPFSLTISIKHFSTGKNDVINVPNIDSNRFNFRIPTTALTLGDHAVSVLKVKDARGCSRKTPEAATVKVAVADLPSITADSKSDYCVGDRIAFTLAGVPPFAVEYEWNKVLMKATNQPSQFVRVAEKAGNFTITGLQDSASDCGVNLNITKIVHEVPSVKISEGAAVVKGIPEGDQAEIMFKFYGTPPFTFTYTRSEIAKKGAKPRILEMHTQVTESYTYSMFASQEGTYEVISIEDAFCSYTAASAGRKG